MKQINAIFTMISLSVFVTLNRPVYANDFMVLYNTMSIQMCSVIAGDLTMIRCPTFLEIIDF